MSGNRIEIGIETEPDPIQNRNQIQIPNPKPKLKPKLNAILFGLREDGTHLHGLEDHFACSTNL